AAGVERVLGVVRVNEVDASGDGLDPVDHAEQLLAAGVRVAGVEAEAGTEVADGIPQPGQVVEPPGDRVVATGGILDQDRKGQPAIPLRVLKSLAPVGETLAEIGAGT